MNYTYEIHNLSDLQLAVQQINLLDKEDRYPFFEELCSQMWENRGIFEEYYSLNQYTHQHIDLAVMLFMQYGLEVYARIKLLIPSYCGGIVANWDGFMVFTISRFSYITIHSYNAKCNDVFKEFVISAIELCDPDLLRELASYINKDQMFSLYGAAIDINNLPDINYDYFVRRTKTIGKNQNGMKRYVHLVGILAGYDYMAAFRSWGDFYYVFEDMYAKKKSKQGFTSDFYSKFSEIDKNRTEETIAIYGWDVLHHLFELDADSDDDSKWFCLGQSKVYANLSLEDKEKANIAIKEFKKITKKRTSTLEFEQEIASLKELFKTDYEIGISAWSNYLMDMSALPKVPKSRMKKALDGLLWDICESERLYENRDKAIKAKHPTISFIEIECSPVINLAFEDEWIREFFCTHCQGHGCVGKYLSSLLFVNNTERIDQIMEFLYRNPNLEISPDTILKKAKDNLLHSIMLECHRNLILNVAQTLEQYPNFLSEINNLFRFFFQDKKEEALRYWHKICEISVEKENYRGVLLNTDNVVSALEIDADLDAEIYRNNIWLFEYVFKYSANTELLYSVIENLHRFPTKYSFKSFIHGNISKNSFLVEEEKQRLLAVLG